MAKNKDIPGQVGLDGQYIRKPKPQAELKPNRESHPIKAKRRKFNLVKIGNEWVPLKPDEFTELD